MSGCKFIIILSLLTSHLSASQEHRKINITLESHVIDYGAFTCPSMGGMILGKDYLILSGNLTINGIDTAFNASFGLLVERDIDKSPNTQIENSTCEERSEVNMDTCVCTYQDTYGLDFRCNLTASCAMSGHLYVYMNLNGSYYYTDSVSIVQTNALCESPPGPFAHCFNGKEKRIVTYPFDRSHARSSCKAGLLHEVDHFNMTGRIKLKDIPPNTVIDVHFAVVPRNDNSSVKILGKGIHFRYRSCVPLDQNVNNTCACDGVELDGYRVVCRLLASLEHSRKFGYFQMLIDPPHYFYRGDFVMMPLVLGKCDEIPGPQPTSQDQQNINISLGSYLIDYSDFTCPKLEGLIHGADYMLLTGILNISGLNSSFGATFGLVAEQDVYNHLVTEIILESSNDPQHSGVKMDTCVCTYLDNNELHFTCNLMASCKMSGRLHFYMDYNNIYYYTDSISILKVFARCESPPGPFSLCVNGMEKRCITYPFDYSRATHSCLKGLLHGVDHFKMKGRVNLDNISNRSKIFVNFGVTFMNDNSSVFFLGTTIDMMLRKCPPLEKNVMNSCACLGVELDGFSVVCVFLASLEHSQMVGFFQMSVDGRIYVGDFVWMPLVLDECQEMKGFTFLPRLMYVTIIFLIGAIMTGLMYKFICSKSSNISAEGDANSEEQVEEKSDGHSNEDGSSSIDNTDPSSSEKGSKKGSDKESVKECDKDSDEENYMRSDIVGESSVDSPSFIPRARGRYKRSDKDKNTQQNTGAESPQ